MSYQIFNEASLGKFIELIQNKVRSIVDNATVASARSATNATNDADGNAIKTTYRKVADSYTKAEVDAAVSGKVSKSGDTMTGKLTAPKIETGTGEANYFQTMKVRGEGDADTYSHAIDFGHANHDMVDFHEHGGVWNFYQNTEGKSNTGSLVASIQPDGVHAPLKGNADTATSATMATHDSDGNAINTTYRKISDSYSKSEVDEKVGKSSSSTILTTDDLIKNYRVHEIIEMLNKGSTVYLKATENDTFFKSLGLSGQVMPVYMFYGEAGSEMEIAWGETFYMPEVKSSFTAIVSSHVTGFEAVHGADGFQFEYSVTGANAVVSISTLVLPYTSWDSTTKTITVSASLVSNNPNFAVEVSPEESSFDDYVNAGIRASSLGNGKITFSCKTVPTKTITVNIKVSIIFTQTGNRLGTETGN